MSLEGLSGLIRSVHSAARRLCNGEPLLYMKDNWGEVYHVSGLHWVQLDKHWMKSRSTSMVQLWSSSSDLNCTTAGNRAG